MNNIYKDISSRMFNAWRNCKHINVIMVRENTNEYKSTVPINELINRKCNMGKKYVVCALGYDKNDCITDYERIFGMFDNFAEAYSLINTLGTQDIDSFFIDVPSNVSKLLFQLEECEEIEDMMTCIDIHAEFTIVKPY